MLIQTNQGPHIGAHPKIQGPHDIFNWPLLCSGSPRRYSCAAARRSCGAAARRSSCAAAPRSFLVAVLRLSSFIVAARRSVDFATTFGTLAKTFVSMVSPIRATMRTHCLTFFKNQF